MQVIAPNITEAQIEAMLTRTDTLGDQPISFPEFQAIFPSLKR
jgi:hypothetical protein